ncbi:ubiquitin-conjugating enzyme E2 M [[Emmonsia] crescens]|uniref:NEDD8-conjugating enzyme UBC12 n=1 Tax=[Emmonsia] crescens TaxID=73230 RepID=A0A0G2I863_9EURO|nr:ubiquitin-conjugating enzyme E2 M [Emmonsia crescens UAMH 3008]
MYKIWSLKRKQQEEAAAAAAAGKPTTRVGAVELRLQHDFARIEKDELQREKDGRPKIIDFHYKNRDNPFHFSLVIEPDEGMYKGGSFKFTFDIPRGEEAFPFFPPKVKCTQKIYHPNIDPQGNVCLNILRDAWNPILDLNSVAFGLLHIFLEPNYVDPLNKEAAEDLRLNREGFRRNVRTAMQGGTVRDIQYDRVLR